jgi:glycosyltransferase
VAAAFDDPLVEACYGDLFYVKEQGSRHELQDSGGTTQNSKFKTPNFRVVRNWKSGEYSPERFYWGWMPPHPTFFVRRSLYERYGTFNLELGSAADYELMLRFLLKHEITTAYIPEVLVIMRTGGVSNVSLKNRLSANRMDRLAWQVNGLKPYPWTLFLKPIMKIPQFLLLRGR